MKTFILGVGSFTAADLGGYSVPPAWRKATRNMIFATASQERALEMLRLSDEDRSSMGLVLGTVSGELETSADFLTTLSKTGVARPLLFQNSLHNATTGFASIHFRFTGPSFTVSANERTPGECLEMARTLISEGHCKFCLVTLVEAHKAMADLISEKLTEGACSIVLCGEETARSFEPLGELTARWYDDYPISSTAPLVDVTASSFFTQVRALES
jgi:hypothetical protein